MSSPSFQDNSEVDGYFGKPQSSTEVSWDLHPNPFDRRLTRIMSVTLLLFLVAIAATVVFFADSAAQWSLRLILDEGAYLPRTKAETPPAEAPEGNPAAQTKAA